MDGELGLGGLCRRGGWTYAVLWRIDRRDPRLLVLEESYYEEKNGRIFEEMINQVHAIGQGIIGEVALSGKHRWINFDAQCVESSEISTTFKSYMFMFKENVGWQHQIFAGIKTVAVISLPPLGVILFGSTQMICESADFIALAQHLLLQLGIKKLGYDHANRSFTHPQATFATVISSLGSSSFKNSIWRDDACKHRHGNHLSSEYSPLASGLQSSSIPVTSTSSSSINGFNNILHERPSSNSLAHKFTKQQEGLSEAQINIELHSKFKYPSNLLTNNFKSNPQAKEIGSFSCMEHKSFPKLTLPGVFNMIPSSSKASTFTPELSENFLTSPQNLNPENSTFSFSTNDLFDGMDLDLNPMILRRDCWDDFILPIATNNCISDLELGSVTGPGKEFFSDSNLEQLLEAVVAGNSKISSSCKTLITETNASASQDSRHESPAKVSDSQADHLPVADASSLIQTPVVSVPEWNTKTMILEDSGNVNVESSAFNEPKKAEESVKVVRKRARPGESTRPRPKDRQQIQDRVKELREIVPNGAKCSIDALLDRTIRHLLFLQSVTKYADKLKQADEPKIIGEESGVVLKDNTNGGLGATWAYEVAGQTMVCPILIEDLHPSGQMLVEMLCEERGFFLEIADVVRGFGLTILKGVMENRGRKVWARFIVEANRDVTRMDIFLSLVHLLQQTCSSIRSYEPLARVIDTPLTTYQRSTTAIPIGLAHRVQ